MKTRLITLLALLVLSPVIFGSWDQFQGNCKHEAEKCDVTITTPLCIKWKIPVSMMNGALPLVDDDGNIFYNGGTGVQKISITTGRLQWASPYNNGGSMNCSGVLYNGAYIYPKANSFTALDKTTGAVLWDKPCVGMTGYFYLAGGGGTYSNNPAPSLKGNMIYMGTSAGELVVVNADTGDTVKVIKVCSSQFSACPAVDDNNVAYIGCWDNYFYAIDTASGSVKWKTNMAAMMESSASIDDTGIFFAVGDKIVKLNKADGSTAWSKYTGSFCNASGAMDNDSYYCGSDDRFVYRFDKSTGTIKWKVYIEDNMANMSCIIVCAKLYVTGCIDKMVMLDTVTGSKDFVCHSMAPNFSNMTSYRDNLLFTSDDGNMYVVGECPASCPVCSCDSKNITPSPTDTVGPQPSATYTPTLPPTFTVTFTSTCTPTLTPTNTITMSVTATVSPTFTPSSTSTMTNTALSTPSVTPTVTVTQMPCNGTATPGFTVNIAADPEGSDNQIITVESSSELSAPPSVKVCPHGLQAQASGTMSAQCNITCMTYIASAMPGETRKFTVVYPKQTGFGDIDTIVVTGRDICGTNGTSSGSFTRTVISGKDVKLYKNIINPDLGERTMIHYKVYSACNCTVKIVNRSGVTVKTIVSSEYKQSGEYDVYWDGTDDHGRKVASGIYSVNVKTANYSSSDKVSVIR